MCGLIGRRPNRVNAGRRRGGLNAGRRPNGRARKESAIKDDHPAIPGEAARVLTALRRHLGDSLVAACLHGSAITGGLRPGSDVDLIAVIDAPMPTSVRHGLLKDLMELSGRHPRDADGSRPVELIVFVEADLAALAYPARSDFVYGEWLRDAFEGGAVPKPESDPEYTLVLAQARGEATSLAGPALAELLPEIAPTFIRRAIADALPALMAGLDHDRRNVLLTLARMWRTLAIGDFVPKDTAARWAAPRLPEKAGAVLILAAEHYRGTARDAPPLASSQAAEAAHLLQERVRAMLARNDAD